IAQDDLPLEFMMNALRLSGGVEESLFFRRTGLPIESVRVKLAQLRNKKLLVPDRLQATDLGQRYLNTVLEQFL
ncbi:MAG: YggW family oxidoreductase, partial [Pseudomonadota bacterium]|nr:YggW family oxidoreductase [Pseudomonadota bacterium]